MYVAMSVVHDLLIGLVGWITTPMRGVDGSGEVELCICGGMEMFIVCFVDLLLRG